LTGLPPFERYERFDDLFGAGRGDSSGPTHAEAVSLARAHVRWAQFAVQTHLHLKAHRALMPIIVDVFARKWDVRVVSILHKASPADRWQVRVHDPPTMTTVDFTFDADGDWSYEPF
jgi:hypothetical protein